MIKLKKKKKDIKPYRYDMDQQAYVTNINAALIHEAEVMTADANVLVQKFDSGLIIQYWFYLDGYCECLINKPYRVVSLFEEGAQKVYLRIENSEVTYKLSEPFGKVTRYVVNGEAKPGYSDITNICR